MEVRQTQVKGNIKLENRIPISYLACCNDNPYWLHNLDLLFLFLAFISHKGTQSNHGMFLWLYISIMYNKKYIMPIILLYQWRKTHVSVQGVCDTICLYIRGWTNSIDNYAVWNTSKRPFYLSVIRKRFDK